MISRCIIISLKSYEWDHDIISLHEFAKWYITHEIILYEIKISYPDFIYKITSWFQGIWNHIIEIIWMGSWYYFTPWMINWKWDMISCNKSFHDFKYEIKIWFHTSKSYHISWCMKYNIEIICMGYSFMKPYMVIPYMISMDIWYHSFMYEIIPMKLYYCLWFHKFIKS